MDIKLFKNVRGCMLQIKFMNIALLSCLFVQCAAMNPLGNSHVKDGSERDAFWNEQFGRDNKFKKLDPRLQQYMARNFMLPRAKAVKKQVTDKMCLPLVVGGLTPIKMENIEKSLSDFYNQFKKKYPKRPANESLRPSIIAYVDRESEMQEVSANSGDRQLSGDERVVLYSNGSIEWHAREDEQKEINELSAEKKF
jgi:hypothetical protein